MTEQERTEAKQAAAGAQPGERDDAAAMSAAELAAVRDLALKAHPDAVPELVSGGSVAELLASLEPARAAYRRIVEAQATPTPAAGIPAVPAGDAPRVAIDPDRLPATEKIRRGLAVRRP